MREIDGDRGREALHDDFAVDGRVSGGRDGGAERVRGGDDGRGERDERRRRREVVVAVVVVVASVDSGSGAAVVVAGIVGNRGRVGACPGISPLHVDR